MSGILSQIERMSNSDNLIYFDKRNDGTTSAKSVGLLKRFFSWSLTSTRFNQDRDEFLSEVRSKYGRGIYEMAKAMVEATGKTGITVTMAKDILNVAGQLSKDVNVLLGNIHKVYGEDIALACTEMVSQKVNLNGGTTTGMDMAMLKDDVKHLVHLLNPSLELAVRLNELQKNPDLELPSEPHKEVISRTDAVTLGKALGSVIIKSDATAKMVEYAREGDHELRKVCKLPNLLRGCQLFFDASMTNDDKDDEEVKKGEFLLTKLAPRLDKIAKNGVPSKLTVGYELLVKQCNENKVVMRNSGFFSSNTTTQMMVDHLYGAYNPK